MAAICYCVTRLDCGAFRGDSPAFLPDRLADGTTSARRSSSWQFEQRALLSPRPTSPRRRRPATPTLEAMLSSGMATRHLIEEGLSSPRSFWPRHRLLRRAHDVRVDRRPPRTASACERTCTLLDHRRRSRRPYLDFASARSSAATAASLETAPATMSPRRSPTDPMRNCHRPSGKPRHPARASTNARCVGPGRHRFDASSQNASPLHFQALAPVTRRPPPTPSR